MMCNDILIFQKIVLSLFIAVRAMYCLHGFWIWSRISWASPHGNSACIIQGDGSQVSSMNEPQSECTWQPIWNGCNTCPCTLTEGFLEHHQESTPSVVSSCTISGSVLAQVPGYISNEAWFSFVSNCIPSISPEWRHITTVLCDLTTSLPDKSARSSWVVAPICVSQRSTEVPVSGQSCGRW